MSISGIGLYNNSYLPSALTRGATANGGGATAGAAAAAPAAMSPTDSAFGAGASSGSGALQWLTNYLKESPAKQYEDAWLAQHHLTEQQLNAMPPGAQAAIRKQMEDDIKKKLQEQAGGSGTGAALDIRT
jgi:hypothetical protein